MSPIETSATVDEANPSASSHRIAWLDGWRGLAILSVLVGHFGSFYVPALSVLGGYGVELFFVLSGRLMAEILFVTRHPLPDFFRRRFARIFPALLAFATAMAVAAIAGFIVTGKKLMEPWEYLSAISFTINYVQVLGGEESRTLAHIWSLAVEEHSYLILAVMALAVARNVEKAKWILAVAGILALLNGIRLYEAGAGGLHEIYWRTDVRVAPVFLSAASFLFFHRAKFSAKIQRLLGYLPLLCVPLSVGLCFQPQFVLTYSCSAVLLALSVNTLKYSPEWLRSFLSIRLLTICGLLSYSFYLWQQPFFRVAGAKIASPLAALPAALVCGMLSYYIIERPARKWINGLRLGLKRKAGGARI